MNRHLRLTRRRFLVTTTALAATAVVAGQGLAPAARAATRGGTLRISVDQAPGKLNPLLHRVNPEYLLGEMLYSGLTRLGDDMAPEPDLAESWSSSDDLTEWTFKLRENAAFHDGSPVTADDVVATFEAILDPKTGSPGRKNVGPIASLSAAGPHSVVIKTSGAYADLPVSVAYTNAKIVPAKIAKGELARLDQEAIGTGPFKLVSYEPERLVVLERNPHYFLPERPYLDRVEVVVYPDATAESTALIAGDTDLMIRAGQSDFPRLKEAAGVEALRTPSGQFLDLVLGCDQKPFDDIRVRQALALTLDRDALVDFIAEGYGTPGEDTPINSAYRFFDKLPAKKPDIAKAKQLLAEAGHTEGLKLTLIASDKPAMRTQLGVAVREMAKAAGFDIEVQTMAHSTYLDQVWKKGPFYVGFYNMQPSADSIFSLLYTSDAPWNETKWNNKDFDSLIQQARQTGDVPKRKALYAKAQELMSAEVPSAIPVFFDLLAARRSYVEGFFLHPRGAVFNIDKVSLGAGAPKRG
ncbi:peptide/nickel transport system substrate-binding protein [Tistlia consotensis]|uniref:Peptide/nickel transport system substrate-binding protein n=1 Tax=Tistlia consotensis USBA 355 TaxID=560819 RepID=A0A1Y6B9F7_9PROT|nr:ABC transporter substrate-binding protein [Tistlia consotensis]SME98335.1 peptide/nickel transport system substrate-binding protein [Tistlia consotensis USBA 355]SNR57663.1 peptide/nickel transport system substrate-binding protein [Tistlia consotensis]